MRGGGVGQSHLPGLHLDVKESGHLSTDDQEQLTAQ